MTETVEGNTVRAEEISYDFSTHTWEIVYSDNESDRKVFHVYAELDRDEHRDYINELKARQ